MRRFLILPVAVSLAVMLASAAPLGARSASRYPGGLYVQEKVPSGGLIMRDSTLEVSIYLPPGCRKHGRKYPVLYLFHGVIDDNMSWEKKGGVVAMTDEAIRRGVIKPFIIVMPKAFLSFYVDNFSLLDGTPGHKYETFFFTRLMPYIEEHYPVRTDRAHTAVAGISMGGYGASVYAFKHPERFCMAYSMSGATAGLDWIWLARGDEVVPSIRKIFADRDYTQKDFPDLPDYYMDCGKNDPVCGGFNSLTHFFLNSIGFPHEYRQFGGTHNWDYWKGCYRRLLPDLSTHFDKN